MQRERGLIQAVFEAARRDRLITHNRWEHVEKEPGDARNRILTEAHEAKVLALTKKATKALDDQWAEEKCGWTQHDSRYRDVLFAAAKRAGILKSDSFPHDSLRPHDLRHTFGARFLRRGGDIYVLSKMLGHSSVPVTQRYAFIAPDDVGAKVLAVMEA